MMPVKSTTTTDSIFPHITISPASDAPEDVAEFVRDLIADVRKAANFDGMLSEVEQCAKAVLVDHPGMGTETGSVKADAPACVQEAVTILCSLPPFRKSLGETDAHEAGVQGFYLGLVYGHLQARQYEKDAARGRRQIAGASQGGKTRASTRQWTREYAEMVEREISAEKQRNPRVKMQVIQARFAHDYKLSRTALLARIRRAKKSSRQS